MLWQPPPATAAGKNAGKVYFVSQTGVAPPTFVCMCNDPKAFPKNYRRFWSGSCASRCPSRGRRCASSFEPDASAKQKGTGGSGRGKYFVSISQISRGDGVGTLRQRPNTASVLGRLDDRWSRAFMSRNPSLGRKNRARVVDVTG